MSNASKSQLQREELSQRIRNAINDWKKEKLIEMVMMAKKSGFSSLEILNDFLLPELLNACSQHDEFYLTFSELILIADTIQGAFDILIPEIKTLIPRDQAKGVVVIGTVQGDIHDFGKNLVAAILQSGGFHVIDLGRDVPLKKFLASPRRKRSMS